MSSPSQPIENIFPPACDLSPSVDAPPGPPPELNEQIRRAAVIDGQLRACGESVRFESPMDGPLQVELRRPEDGSAVRLTAAQAVALACGGTV